MITKPKGQENNPLKPFIPKCHQPGHSTDQLPGNEPYELWDHCIDSRTIVQESPAALIIDSTSSYVFRSTLVSEWVWIQKGSLLWCICAQGIWCGDVHWVAAGFWGALAPFFAVPSLVFKYAFQADLLISFWQSHMRWLGLPHLKQLLFFFWYSLTALAK